MYLFGLIGAFFGAFVEVLIESLVMEACKMIKEDEGRTEKEKEKAIASVVMYHDFTGRIGEGIGLITGGILMSYISYRDCNFQSLPIKLTS